MEVVKIIQRAYVPPEEGESMASEGELPTEGECLLPAEGENKPPDEGEGEGENIVEGEMEPPIEGEGEAINEGEVGPSEEGETITEAEGESSAEGETNHESEGESGTKYSGGSGATNDPYRIGNAADWKALCTSTTDWDKHFILIRDIDFSGMILSPISPNTAKRLPFEGTPFSGVFDGGNHVLRNGKIDFRNRP